MAGKKITVVLSQSPSHNPAHRQLEESLAAELIMDRDVDVSLVPHLYDMSADHTGMLFLRSVPGDMIVLGWLYPRALRWVLDRQGIRGQEGISLLVDDDENDDSDDNGNGADGASETEGGIPREVPNRKIYCIDLRVRQQAADYLDEIRRIAKESSVQTVSLMDWIQGNPNQRQLERYLHPERMLKADGPGSNGNGDKPENGNNGAASTRDDPSLLPEPTRRRWYPVIDYSRCTNCMECIDFCLFGVYGLDKQDVILVEQQDNCKKGCPACSRVCPENAIIFPGHKTPAIAGAQGEVAGLKIDLSKLFGAPDPLALAVAERDAELVADGRAAVGMTVGIPKRQQNKTEQQRDELDDLLDALDV